MKDEELLKKETTHSEWCDVIGNIRRCYKSSGRPKWMATDEQKWSVI